MALSPFSPPTRQLTLRSFGWHASKSDLALVVAITFYGTVGCLDREQLVVLLGGDHCSVGVRTVQLVVQLSDAHASGLHLSVLLGSRSDYCSFGHVVRRPVCHGGNTSHVLGDWLQYCSRILSASDERFWSVAPGTSCRMGDRMKPNRLSRRAYAKITRVLLTLAERRITWD